MSETTMFQINALIALTYLARLIHPSDIIHVTETLEYANPSLLVSEN